MFWRSNCRAFLYLGFADLELTGFSLGEIDGILSDAAEKSPLEPGPEDSLPEHSGVAVSRPGDLWILGAHRLICGDAQNEADYVRVLAGKPADLVLTDPPYNVPITRHGRRPARSCVRTRAAYSRSDVARL